MYNHYTPQSDGSYQRSSRPEPQRRPTSPQMNIPTSPPPAQSQGPAQSCREPEPRPPQPGIASFLQGLLPCGFDTADLMILFLVLLMDRADGGDGCSPFLTLALYFLL